MDMEVFLEKERIFPGALKICAAIPGPRITANNFCRHEDFLKLTVTVQNWVETCPNPETSQDH